MPTYEYKCNDCQESFELFHLMSESIDKCELCGSSRIQKVIGNFSLIKELPHAKNKKPGSVVKKYLKDLKDDLKVQKEHLKKERTK
jgi:putative FmdB family regulatory protein